MRLTYNQVVTLLVALDTRAEFCADRAHAEPDAEDWVDEEKAARELIKIIEELPGNALEITGVVVETS